MHTTIATTRIKGIPPPGVASTNEQQGRAVRRVLLSCGIAASLLYVALNIVVPLFYAGYSSFSQTVSELSAIGAPTRRLWVLGCVPFTIFTAAFGAGVLLSAGRNRALRVAGGLLVTYALVGIFWPPMHQREVLAFGGQSLTDTLHIVFTAVTGLLMMVAMGFAAAALGKAFRLYTLATIVVLLAFGALTSRYAPALQANEPTPWMGVWERVNIYATMLWMVVLAVVLLRRERKPTASFAGVADEGYFIT